MKSKMKSTTWNKVKIGQILRTTSSNDITIEGTKISDYSMKVNGRTIKITTKKDSLKLVRVEREQQPKHAEIKILSVGEATRPALNPVIEAEMKALGLK